MKKVLLVRRIEKEPSKGKRESSIFCTCSLAEIDLDLERFSDLRGLSYVILVEASERKLQKQETLSFTSLDFTFSHSHQSHVLVSNVSHVFHVDIVVFVTFVRSFSRRALEKEK